MYSPDSPVPSGTCLLELVKGSGWSSGLYVLVDRELVGLLAQLDWRLKDAGVVCSIRIWQSRYDPSQFIWTVPRGMQKYEFTDPPKDTDVLLSKTVCVLSRYREQGVTDDVLWQIVTQHHLLWAACRDMSMVVRYRDHDVMNCTFDNLNQTESNSKNASVSHQRVTKAASEKRLKAKSLQELHSIAQFLWNERKIDRTLLRMKSFQDRKESREREQIHQSLREQAQQQSSNGYIPTPVPSTLPSPPSVSGISPEMQAAMERARLEAQRDEMFLLPTIQKPAQTEEERLEQEFLRYVSFGNQHLIHDRARRLEMLQKGDMSQEDFDRFDRLQEKTPPPSDPLQS